MSGRLSQIGWLIGREYWEHRWLLWAPWLLAGVFIALNAGVIGLVIALHSRQMSPASLHALFASQADAGNLRAVGNAFSPVVYAGVALLALALGVMLIAYALAALYDERRDGSILFWKALPIGDGQVVASKAIVAWILLPCNAMAAGLAAAWLSLMAYLATLASFGLPLGQSALYASALRITVIVLASLPVYVLTLIPCIGWLLLCSAASRWRPALPAFGVPLVLWVVSLLGLSNTLWRSLMANTFPIWLLTDSRSVSSGPLAAVSSMARHGGFDMLGPMTHLLTDPGVWIALMLSQTEVRPSIAATLTPLYAQLLSPALWIGIVAGAAFLIVAARHRRRGAILS